MTTKEVVEHFYKNLQEKKDWESFFADDMMFINNGQHVPVKEAMKGIQEFYAMVHSFEVQEILVDGEKVSAIVSYRLQLPTGKSLSSVVAEFFTVKEGKFLTFGIYFDSAPFTP